MSTGEWILVIRKILIKKMIKIYYFVLGYIHIGYKQELFINDTNSDIPFNAHESYNSES
jgi:hypothetical protein